MADITRPEFEQFKEHVHDLLQEVRHDVKALPGTVRVIVGDAVDPLTAEIAKQNGRLGRVEDTVVRREAQFQAVKWGLTTFWASVTGAVLWLISHFLSDLP